MAFSASAVVEKQLHQARESVKNKMIVSRVTFPKRSDFPKNIKPVFNEYQHALSLSSRFFHVHYAKACDLNVFLIKKGESVLSARGKSQCDARSNSLWVEDDVQSLKRVAGLIHQLDVPVPQLLIKARIVNINNQAITKLGIHFISQADPGGLTQHGFLMRFPRVDTSMGSLTVPLAHLGGDMLLDMQLDALQHLGQAKIIASPELLTESGKAASIEAGEEVPYQQQIEGGGTSVAFKKAVLRLQVIPKVLPNNKILLQLSINQDQVSSLRVNGVPAIRTQQLKTQALVNNGETVVLGGIYETIDSNEKDSMAGLAKIPLLGLLFQHRLHEHERRQLLLFVTPRIMTRKLA